MSERIKEKIGEELYNKVLEAGLKADEFDLINDGNYIPRSRLNQVSDKLKATEGKVVSYEKQLEDTKKLLESSEDFKDKYNSLETKYNDDIQLKDKEILNISKRYAVESSLLKEGAKHTDLLLKDIDFENLTFDKNNNVLGIDDEMKRLKEKRSDFFPKTKSNSTNTKLSDDDKGNIDDDNDDWGKRLEHIGKSK